MNRVDAFVLLKERVREKNLIRHSLAVESVMKEIAEFFNQDILVWSLAGLLHDVDYEETKNSPQLHSLRGGEILQNLGLPDEIVSAVKAHNQVHRLPRLALLDKVLFATDPLTGLITASALVLPSKKLADLKVGSILKRFKEVRFAAGADRPAIQSIEESGLSLEKFIELGLRAMQQVAVDLEL